MRVAAAVMRVAAAAMRVAAAVMRVATAAVATQMLVIVATRCADIFVLDSPFKGLTTGVLMCILITWAFVACRFRKIHRMVPTPECFRRSVAVDTHLPAT